MAGNRTLAIIKPDAIASGKAGLVLAQLQKEGFESQTVTALFVKGETRAKANATLKPLSGKPGRGMVRVNTVPSDAVVFVDGKRRGTTPVTIDDLNPRDRYEIKVAKSGYESQTAPLNFDGKLERSLDFTLRTDAGDRQQPRVARTVSD